MNKRIMKKQQKRYKYDEKDGWKLYQECFRLRDIGIIKKIPEHVMNKFNHFITPENPYICKAMRQVAAKRRLKANKKG